MTDQSKPDAVTQDHDADVLVTAVNVVSTPSVAFRTIRAYPHSLFPVAVVLISTMMVTGWYFNILDFDWYIDDTLSRTPDLRGSDLDDARQGMQALSQRGMMLLGTVGSAISLLAIYLAQTAYLSLISALRGDELRFRQWFALVAWCNLPNVFLTISMAVTILLNPSGQLSNFDLNPLSLYSLGMQSANQSLNQVLAALNLVQFWTLALLIFAYRQWVKTGTVRALVTVLAPYLLIFGIWTYFALA